MVKRGYYLKTKPKLKETFARKITRKIDGMH